MVIHIPKHSIIVDVFFQPQRQIFNISEGVSSLVQKLFLAGYDKSYLSDNIYFVKGGRIPILSLNKICEKSRTTIIFANFVSHK